jgi:ribonucleoside-diphosphate reductase alpha chain
MNSYQELIAKSRYARYIPELSRRENWDETADRWITFFKDHYKGKINDQWEGWNDLSYSIKNLKSLPSMRSIMTAGEALRRTNVAAYNCSYLPVDHPRAFDEAMYILLCGTGVGFSCEAAYVNKLPVVPELVGVGSTILVADSKEGWCKAFKELIMGLYHGNILSWDVSQVRPAGAPLKTFGGRASGPAPLVSLFEYTVAKFKGAQNRMLKPIEVHDIMCKIGEVVVVGGVRRSAMISLGDLGDYEHATAKTGAWWEQHGERALSNNSAVYNSKPSIGVFMKEWNDIYNSHSGERGIFNREASQNQAAKWGRRSADVDYGTNPCAEIILKPYQFCNLSTVVVEPDDTLESLKKKVCIATIMGTMQSDLTYFPYLRNIWTKNTEAERLLGVSLTGIFDNRLLRHERGLPAVLAELRDTARDTNRVMAEMLGISCSVAITAIKPEGTVSQLTQTSSGIHAGHAPYYIRRIRQDKKDPLTQFLIDQGVPHENCVMKPKDTVVFSFPQHSPGFTRKDITAIEHLDIWLAYQRHYCEHKPSVTISVKDHEWMEVGAWVYKHFDECTGISFLPDDGGTYQQAPYEECTKEQYEAMQMPAIDWSLFIEEQDNVEGAQTLACSANGCEI